VAKVSGAESQSYLGALPKQNLLTKSLSTEEEPRSPTYKYFESDKAFKENGSKHFESEKASTENGAKHFESERNSKENGAKYFESEKTRLEKEERAAILALWKREHDDRAK
jgi:hypothetical protein